ncbi:MAG: hypothetical protein AAGH15_26460 [Myxococcota bacterium]
MNSILRGLVLAAALLAGCSAINDTSGFRSDEGCNLDLRLNQFRPHLNDRFEIRVIHQRIGQTVPTLDALAVFEPLSGPGRSDFNFRLIMPNAVFPQEQAGLQPGTVDFYAEVNDVGGYQFDLDHGWRLEGVCLDLPAATANAPATPFTAPNDQGTVFTHEFFFDDFPDPDGAPLGLEVEFFFDGMSFPDGTDLDLAAAEVHVEGIELPSRVGDGGVEQRAVGFFRFSSLGALMRRGDNRARLPDILFDGLEYQVRVLFDLNGDGQFNPGGEDRAFETVVLADTNDLPRCDLGRDPESGLCRRFANRFTSEGVEPLAIELVSVPLEISTAEDTDINEAEDNWFRELEGE